MFVFAVREHIMADARYTGALPGKMLFCSAWLSRARRSRCQPNTLNGPFSFVSVLNSYWSGGTHRYVDWILPDVYYSSTGLSTHK